VALVHGQAEVDQVADHEDDLLADGRRAALTVCRGLKKKYILLGGYSKQMGKTCVSPKALAYIQLKKLNAQCTELLNLSGDAIKKKNVFFLILSNVKSVSNNNFIITRP
jgi:hypothetical protein